VASLFKFASRTMVVQPRCMVDEAAVKLHGEKGTVIGKMVRRESDGQFYAYLFVKIGSGEQVQVGVDMMTHMAAKVDAIAYVIKNNSSGYTFSAMLE
jgi:hypothetical protein